MLSQEGGFSQVYGKNHVFGERPPPTSGVYPVFDTPLGRLATLICLGGFVIFILFQIVTERRHKIS